MEIARDLYLSRLRRREGNHLVKVVTGIRRCGKSYLLFHLFRDYLRKKGIPDDHVIEISFDRLRNAPLRQPDAVVKHIDSLLKDGGMYYLLLDEVQYLEDFEGVLNDFLHVDNVDIYVTGSNSRFLSTDILTEFRGRGDEVHVFPLSFAEFCQDRSGEIEQAWQEYLLYGGLPLVRSMSSDEDKSTYLKSLFEKTYLADILQRHRVKKFQGELQELLQVMASSIGSLTNARKLSDTFHSEKHVEITQTTLERYCAYFSEAYLLSKAKRYDLKGRKYINGLSKFYFEDVGLRNAMMNFRQIEETHLQENILYNELRMRGYNVDVGIVELRNSDGDDRKKVEVDFVANLGSKRYYIQSAYAIPDKEKRAKEIRPLLHIDDSFKKIVVTGMNSPTWRDEQGILTMNIRNFLLNPNSLDL